MCHSDFTDMALMKKFPVSYSYDPHDVPAAISSEFIGHVHCRLSGRIRTRDQALTLLERFCAYIAVASNIAKKSGAKLLVVFDFDEVDKIGPTAAQSFMECFLSDVLIDDMFYCFKNMSNVQREIVSTEIEKIISDS